MKKITLKEYQDFVNKLLAPVLSRNMVTLEWSGDGWLSIDYNEPQNYMPRKENNGYRLKTLCAQNMHEYTLQGLSDRIILMAFCKIQDSTQQLNGILDENILTKKPLK